MPDYSNWITKQQAANFLDVHPKQIERWANDKRIQHAKWKRPGGGPKISVYHPLDVERIARDRTPDAGPFVLPAAGDEKPTNLPHSIAARQASVEEFLQNIVTAVSTSASQTSATHSNVRLAERLYLTLPEAAELAGLGVSYLRRQIIEGKLELVKGAGPRRADVVRRTDLEKL